MNVTSFAWCHYILLWHVCIYRSFLRPIGLAQLNQPFGQPLKRLQRLRAASELGVADYALRRAGADSSQRSVEAVAIREIAVQGVGI